MSFFDSMAPALASTLTERGYETLTAVQMAVLGEDAQNADLLVSAQTGSGKTVAFGLAMAPVLLGDAEVLGEVSVPMALVIAPTRELAMQVQRELQWLYAKAGARIGSCVGGMDMRKERRALADGPHIVVGTPGRLRDHITRGSLDISGLRVVVLDEADEMLDLGFREDLEFILAAAPQERRTFLFSATFAKPIVQLAKRFQRNAVRLSTVAESQPHADIDYRLLMVAPTERENAIINALLYYDSQNALVFCGTRDAVRHLTSRLANRGFHVVALSGELTQAERTNALQAMRDGRARVCVATDVAARGIDLPNLDLVIHADLPTNPESLLHRSGRTGRAGRKGVCALIVPFYRRNAASRLMQLAKLDATMEPAPGPVEITARTQAQILSDESLFAAPQEDEVEFVGKLLASYGAEQIAAAFLRQQMAARPAPEELSEAREGSQAITRPERGERADRYERPERGERPERSGNRFESGVWFRVSLGRKHRAEPRWLLPMICKAGHVTKAAVGSIKVGDTTTDFEISTALADAFEATITANGTGEKGVTITRAEGGGRPAPTGSRSPDGPKPVRKLRVKPDIAFRAAEGAGATTSKPMGKPGKKKSYKPKPGRDTR
ncbi:MAG: DEAD/DEAH box helicase [Alphaproteobacteria bacterium]|nr:DEAD/DEAH box helicase [Alphaproteobacteria bacterium]MBU0798417.1 DEAD/DEAH box helicase [Alphaproteobacteria bacterium]MBU0889096.1 DEAD/DEAH box helicase [Alphaproteobacteria bacterium]MBU1813279.1 DEAD/DEAH box helicase [Alphaproteobacteria bacterium]